MDARVRGTGREWADPGTALYVWIWKGTVAGGTVGSRVGVFEVGKITELLTVW